MANVPHPMAVPDSACLCQDNASVDAPLKRLNTEHGPYLVIPWNLLSTSVMGMRHEFYIDHEQCRDCLADVFKLGFRDFGMADQRGPLGNLSVQNYGIDAPYMAPLPEGSTDNFPGPWNSLSGTHLQTQTPVPSSIRPAPCSRQRQSSFRIPTGQNVPSQTPSHGSDWQDVPYKRGPNGGNGPSRNSHAPSVGRINHTPDFASPNRYNVIAERAPGSTNPPRAIPPSSSGFLSSSTSTTPSGKGRRFHGKPYNRWRFSLLKQYQSLGLGACGFCKQKHVTCKLGHIDPGVLARVPDDVWAGCPSPMQLKQELLAPRATPGVDNRVLRIVQQLSVRSD